MKKPVPVFPSFSRPSSDFPAVRTEMRAPPMYREIDLSAARSLAAGTAEVLPIVGNMIYVDQKANSGYAVLHVQDDSYVGNTPITAFPGFLVRVPFTQIIFENEAQPGQVMRLIYGTDLDFVPTVGAGVSVLNAVNINDQVDPLCEIVRFQNTAEPIGVNLNVLVAPATNVRGLRLRSTAIFGNAGAGGTLTQHLIASLVAPGGVFAPQSNAIVLMTMVNATTTFQVIQKNALWRVIPAGWGLYLIDWCAVAIGSVGSMVSVEVL
jgi:hypothetical protein